MTHYFIIKVPEKRELQQRALNHFMVLWSFTKIILKNDFHLQWMIQLCHLGKTHYKMTVRKKIKGINNEIEQNKAHYNLDRQTAKISALSSRNIIKHEFLTGEDILPEKELLELAPTIKNVNIHQYIVSWKSKLKLQENNTKA